MVIDVDPKRFVWSNYLREMRIINSKSRRTVTRVLNLWRDLNNMNLFLNLFSVSLLVTRQSLKLKRSWFRLRSMGIGGNQVIYRQKSNVCHQHTSEELKLSGNLGDHLIKDNINKSWPRIVPWGMLNEGHFLPAEREPFAKHFEYGRENSIPTT